MIQIITVANLLLTILAFEANTSLYSKTEVITNQMEYLEIKYPNIVNISHCHQDPAIKYAALGNPNSSVKAIITCGAHARQLLSSELCLHFLNSVVKKWDEYSDLYLLVFPVVNKNRNKVIEGQLCLRGNERGVDPNRNYPVNFENGDAENGSQTYRGPHPLSEKFSQCIDKILSEKKWNMILDIHTGELTLFYAKVQNNTLNRQTVRMLRQLKKKYCPICIVDTIEHLEGSIAGEMFKYAAVKYQVEHSLEFEVYSGSPVEKEKDTEEDKKNNCMKQFSPNTERSRDFYLNKWSLALQELLNLLIALKKK